MNNSRIQGGVAMKNVSVKIKMLSVAFMTIMGMIIICIFTMTKTTQMQKNAEETLHKSIEEDYDENHRREVKDVFSETNNRMS